MDVNRRGSPSCAAATKGLGPAMDGPPTAIGCIKMLALRHKPMAQFNGQCRMSNADRRQRIGNIT